VGIRTTPTSVPSTSRTSIPQYRHDYQATSLGPAVRCGSADERERPDHPKYRTDHPNGGTNWILGYKTEGCGPLLLATNSATTEILADFTASTFQTPLRLPRLRHHQLYGSFGFATIFYPTTNPQNYDFSTYVLETQNGTSANEPRASIPGREGSNSNSSRVLSLYVGGSH